jgi:hypothetical protein
MIRIEKVLPAVRWSMLAAIVAGAGAGGSTAEAGRIRHQATVVHPASKVASGIDSLWSRAVQSVETGFTTSTDQGRTSLTTLYQTIFPQHKASHPALRIRTMHWHRYRATAPPEPQILAAAMPSPTLSSPSAPTAASARRPLVAEAQVLGPAQAVPEPSGLLVACLLIGAAVAYRRRPG